MIFLEYFFFIKNLIGLGTKYKPNFPIKKEIEEKIK